VKLHPLCAPVALAVMTFILIGMIVFAVYQTRANADNSHTNAVNSHRIEKNTRAIATYNARTCRAIRGAVHFWVRIRRATEDILDDPTLSPQERSTNENYIIALNQVIRVGNSLPCK
jgi:hypothetical protein